ncbi:Nischarin [Papilio machaon]|uniref:Nischarin n=1 Tax=Papilio machaon TaxID=76193 RepID=A0A194RR69_PAPMA|nr:Nischarin [Papilio machaon]
MSTFIKYRNDSTVSVDEACTKDSVTYYLITVNVGPVKWTVRHRYSDFDELHDKLVSDHGVAKELLPPKKVIRNKTPKFIEQRREGLNDYLKNVFNYLKLTMPYIFAHFLDFHLYDIYFLLQDLAKKCFLEGDKLLLNEKSHKFSPLELHAISERFKMACPATEKQDQMYDFSHVLDFCSQVNSLSIEGSYETWKKLSVINFASNNIKNVDWAIKLVPRLQQLSLSSNRLSDLCDISCLHDLRALNLAMNNFSCCDNWHEKIGNIVKIDLSQNKVASLKGFSRLYSLESLDLSCNLITDIEEVQNICKLPCLEYLWLTANPVASSIDYRVKVIEQFNARMSEICLDNEKASEKEIDTARVLQALRIVKEGKTPSRGVGGRSFGAKSLGQMRRFKSKAVLTVIRKTSFHQNQRE